MLPIWVGAVARQYHSQGYRKGKRTCPKETWQYYMDQAVEHLSKRLGNDFDKEEFLRYAENPDGK